MTQSDTKKLTKSKPCNIFIHNLFVRKCHKIYIKQIYNTSNETLGSSKYGTEFIGFQDKCPNQIVQIFVSIIP